jgi:diguanylate cyclase (GGDEF)-like protein
MPLDVPTLMPLDVPTLMVMGGFVAICAGAVLIGSWRLNQNSQTLLFWGSGSLLSGVGVVALMLGLHWQEPLLLVAANLLLALAHGLLWKGARAFEGKPAPLAMLLVGPALVALAGALMSSTIGALCLVVNAAYLYAAAVSFWYAREPLLPARWPMILYVALHGSVMVLGAISSFTVVSPHAPPLMSLFGIIHFENILFAVGTATSLVALVKGRSEAAAKLSANIDSLTGIANRAAFMLAAENLLARCRHDSAPVSVVMFDLDAFKRINDSHGHAVGDAVIRKFCEVASAAIRHNDVFGRLGGEEFAVVLGRSSIEPATVRAERIRVAFAESCDRIRDHYVNATVSGGVAASCDAEITLAELLERADEALYRAKAAGRNRVKRADTPAQDRAASDVIRVA